MFCDENTKQCAKKHKYLIINKLYKKYSMIIFYIFTKK